MKTSEVLRTAKDLIGTPESWCQGVCGRDLAGDVISPEAFNAGEAGHAVSRCSVAVLLAVAPSEVSHPALLSLSRVLGLDGKLEVIAWNNADERTHADVMAAFDRAIIEQELEEVFAAPTVSEPLRVGVPA